MADTERPGISRDMCLQLLGQLSAAAPQIVEGVISRGMQAELFKEYSYQMGHVHYGGPKFRPPTPQATLDMAMRVLELGNWDNPLHTHARNLVADALGMEKK